MRTLETVILFEIICATVIYLPLRFSFLKKNKDLLRKREILYYALWIVPILAFDWFVIWKPWLDRIFQEASKLII